MKRLKRNPDREDAALRSTAWRAVVIVLWVVLAAVVAAAGLATYLALFTNTCDIRRVNITGSRYLQADYLRQLSGIDDYKNLVTLPVGRIAKNFAANPWIDRVDVSRRLLHTVDIRVFEREPVAVLDYGGLEFLVKGDGFVIAKTTLDEFKELPRIHGGAAQPPEVGAMLTEKKTLDCLKVVAGMPPSLRAILALGNPFDGRGCVFIARPGFNIVYGSPEGGRKKNEMLEVILADLAKNRRDIAYIDIRVPDSPVILPN